MAKPALPADNLLAELPAELSRGLFEKARIITLAADGDTPYCCCLAPVDCVLLQIAARCGGTTQRHDSTIVLPDGGLSLNCHAMLMF